LALVYSNPARLSHRQAGLFANTLPMTCDAKRLTQFLPGGHGDFGPQTHNVGCCAGNYQSLGRTCDGVPAVLKATREELKAGADFIKIMCGGGVASMTDAIETVQFTAEEIRAITTTCKQMGNVHSTSPLFC
jgi:hypothetical protein